MEVGSEIVIGIIQPVGTNSKEVFDCIIDCLKQFHYQTNIIKVSSEVISMFDSAKIDFAGDEFLRISHYMDRGNILREMSDDRAFLMRGVVSYIYEKFHHDGPQEKKAYIIDSLKHPDEVSFLRSTYGDGFHLIGVSDTFENRLSYLKNRKNISEDNARTLLERDNGEEGKNGQHTRDTFQQADYFVDAGEDRKRVEGSIFRLLDLLFGNAFITPTFGEYAMFRAYVASLRSADLSRQIGSVICTEHNEIIAEGVNDCPKAGGGLYWPTISEEDGCYSDTMYGRDYTLGYDSNKKEQSRIIHAILKELGIEENKDTTTKIKRAGIGELTEYGRVVHSEMEALLMCARNSISTRGCTMYVTTFPCHNCAKHIIASGIKRVYYIEPYPKSKALDFYKIEIGITNREENKEKVLFLPFTGVGPHRFLDLFSMTSIRWYKRVRKDSEGNKIEWQRKDAELRNPMPLLSYPDLEKKIYNEFVQAKRTMKGESDER